MLQLNKLEAICKKRKRVGRGGDLGGTSCRGHKGQKARTGSSGELKPWFEGGQMSLSRRVPKVGFNNPFKKNVKIINLHDIELRFSDGDEVTPELLIKKGFLKGKDKFLLKVLGFGELSKKITVKAHAFSNSAVSAIEKSGGKIEIIKEQ
ncbi:50S ribosomal protein L15 [Candidatus Dependentiae bacterium]|nr:50S ribosomal protein L15 [Candidatus Dependentiae bacterium]